MSETATVSLSQSLYRAEQVREGEQQAAERSGLSMRALMAAAGKAVFQQLQQQCHQGARVAVFCGEGNNGGDGYVVARLAQQQGYRVSVFALKPDAELQQVTSNDAQHARQAWRDLGQQEHRFDEFEATQFDIVVDAVFGIGLSRPLEGRLLRWTRDVNQSGLPVLAVDIPSGIDADTGAVLGAAIKATLTVTMVAIKRGLYTGEAPAFVGQLQLADLGVGEAFFNANKADWKLAGCDNYYDWLGKRRVNAHKGDFGHVLVVGGGEGMPGAAILAMKTALRTGAGKVSVACHPDNVGVIAAAQPEAMVHGIHASDALKPLLAQATVVVIGPGLGQSEWAKACFNEVINGNNNVKVVDADGLNLLAQSPQRSDRLVLTPHPGEAGRLLQSSVKDVEQDRFSAVESLRQRFGGQVLLKGAGSLISSERGNFVIGRGSPALASGGMGDCLAGLIGSLLAQKLAPAQALVAGAYWHAVAGEEAGKDGERGTLATDLLLPLRRLVNGLPLE